MKNTEKDFSEKLKEYFGTERWERAVDAQEEQETKSKYPPKNIDFLVKLYKSRFPQKKELAAKKPIRL